MRSDENPYESPGTPPPKRSVSVPWDVILVAVVSFFIGNAVLTAVVFPAFGIWTDVPPSPELLSPTERKDEEIRSVIVGVAILTGSVAISAIATRAYLQRKKDGAA